MPLVFHRKANTMPPIALGGTQCLLTVVLLKTALVQSAAPLPPLSSLRFNYPNARAMQTLHCQMMLDRGFLDNCGFYATCAHTDDILDSYANVVRDVFPALGDAQRQNRVEKLLRGPVGHSGFARLT